MTTEEPFERIEHLTAGMAEERRKDREEYKSLWRDTQRQLNELSARLLQHAEESHAADQQLREADARLGDRIAQLAEADARLGARIDALVSAIGKLIAR